MYVEDIAPKRKKTSCDFELLFVPPVCGFPPALRSRIIAFASIQAKNFTRIRLIEFPGQNGQPGKFSLHNSSDILQDFLRKQPRSDFTIFGICSGAVASLKAATLTNNVSRLFLWEMSPHYKLDMLHKHFYEQRFRIRFCEETVFLPILPLHLIKYVTCNTIYAHGNPSVYCDELTQYDLARNSSHGHHCKISGASHFLEGSDTISKLNILFSAWFDSNTSEIEKYNL